MTALDRFDPFERRIGDAIDEIAAARVPDYLDDILQLTARSPQRPRWTFPERWLPMDTVLTRPLPGRRASFRPLLILALLTALIAGAIAAYVGTRQRLPEPFGIAANGQIAYTLDGDIYVRDSVQGAGRLLVGGDGEQFGPYYSPDGTYLSYGTSTGVVDEIYVARASDASNPIHVAHIPAQGNAQALWAPDSRRIAFIYDVNLRPTLSIASVETGESTVVPLDGILPLDVAWRPPNGAELLLRARIQGGESVGIFILKPDGSGLRNLGLPGLSAYGPAWTLGGPAWSPDGTKIAFNSLVPHPDRQDLYYRVATVNPDGTGVSILPPAEASPLYNQGWAVYSPDGRWIAMESWRTQSDGSAINQLAIVAADGSAPAWNAGPAMPGQSLVKTWSPDGTKVIIAAEEIDTLFIIDPFNGTYERLPFDSDLPDWQRRAP